MKTKTLFFGLLAFPLLACNPNDLALDSNQIAGKQLYKTQCAHCHGADANGAQPGSVDMEVLPPDLTGLTAANDGVFPSNYVMGKIYGFSETGHSKSEMPQFGEGDLGPLIQIEKDGISTPIPFDLVALASYLDSLQE